MMAVHEIRSNESFVVGNTGGGRNNKVLRKSHGNRENPVPEVAIEIIVLIEKGPIY
jgi:hypothetical protein